MLRISWNTTTTALDAAGNLEARSYEHTLQFDAILSETHEGTSTLTEHAVESGAPISDHKRANPDRLTIEALVTNTPLDAPPPSGYGDAQGITTRYAKGDQDGKGAVLLFSATFDRISDVVQTLRRLRLESTPVTVSTRIHTYENVQVVGVSTPREPGDGDSVRVSIELQQVRIARTRMTDTPAPREPRGSPATDRGGQEGTEQQAPLQSRISEGFDRGAERYNETGDMSDGVAGFFEGLAGAG